MRLPDATKLAGTALTEHDLDLHTLHDQLQLVYF